MSQTQKMDLIIQKTMEESTAIEGIAIVEKEGVVLTYALPADLDAGHVVSMSLSLFRVGQSTAEELGRGDMEHAFIKGKNGFIFFTFIDAQLILITLANANAMLGPVFNEVKQLTQRLAENL